MTQTEARSTLTFITFGIQYQRNIPGCVHPEAPWADCDGYLTVVAPDREAARRAVFALLGRRWAFDYDTPPKSAYAPLGELARLVVDPEHDTSVLTVAEWTPLGLGEQIAAMCDAIDAETFTPEHFAPGVWK